MKKKTLIIATGGSGGHVVPAGVLADSLKKDYSILFLTDVRGLRYKQFLPAGIKVISIPCVAMGGKTKVQKIGGLAWTLLGILKTCFIFLLYRPIGVVGIGGYASFPACLVGGLLKKQVILHEQNTVFGKTNRILARFATAIATSFQNTRLLPSSPKAVFTGLPLRQEILNKNSTYPSLDKLIQIVITGGSQGARILNQIGDILARLPLKLRKKMKITHQVVLKEEQKRLMDVYKKAEIKADIKEFILDMPRALEQCHLFIGSSGAMILEVQYLRRPMILIPLRIAADNHQETNAREIEKIGGAKVILDKNFNPKELEFILIDLLSHPEKLKKMHKALAPHDGTPALVDLVRKIMN